MKSDAAPCKSKTNTDCNRHEKNHLYRQVIVIFLHISGTLVLGYFSKSFFRLYTRASFIANRKNIGGFFPRASVTWLFVDELKLNILFYGGNEIEAGAQMRIKRGERATIDFGYWREGRSVDPTGLKHNLSWRFFRQTHRLYFITDKLTNSIFIKYWTHKPKVEYGPTCKS